MMRTMNLKMNMDSGKCSFLVDYTFDILITLFYFEHTVFDNCCSVVVVVVVCVLFVLFDFFKQEHCLFAGIGYMTMM
jgi:hypothetical protein